LNFIQIVKELLASHERRGGRGIGFLIRRVLPPVNRMVSTGVWIPVSVSKSPGLRSAVSNCFRVPSSGATDYVFRLKAALSNMFESSLVGAIAWVNAAIL
jgi:hypothetical protein